MTARDWIGRWRVLRVRALPAAQCDNIIVEYFGASDFNTVSEHGFKQ